jgi:hypothetical protein
MIRRGLLLPVVTAMALSAGTLNGSGFSDFNLNLAKR